MTYDEVLTQVLELLQRDKRVAYRVLKRRFELDDDYLEDLKADLIDAKQLAIDEEGKVLVWTGDEASSPPSAVDTTPAAPPTQPRAADAERRQLTIAFIDLVGSTALSQQLDPEEYHARVQAYQAACQQIIARYEGHVAQYLGDGVLVYSGYPVAHEDDAVRAVQSGLDILTAVRALPFSPPLQVRIGIHTGLVMVGDIGAGEHTERLALGDTPNIAARVQGKAEPDTVVISRDTFRLVQGYFSCEELGVHDLKGVPRPLALYLVQGESEAQSRFEGSVQKGLTPLVGREEELELLLRRWERGKTGDGQIVLLSGEAGIGKSRLVQVLRDRIKEEPHFGAVFHCSPLYQHSALYPVIAWLQRVLGFAKEDTAETKLTKLTQALEPIGMTDAEPLALFAALLSIPLPEDHPPLRLSPQKQKEKTLQALLQWLRQSAGSAPVRLEVEDLQWADPTTLELLGLLNDQVPSFGILVLLTFRPEFTPPWPTQGYMLPLQLSRLPQKQIEGMIERVAGKGLPEEILQQLMTKSDGVPLYIEEMTKNLLESGFLKEVNGHYETTGPLPQLAIPPTLHDSFAARLDRLAPVREIAQIGAVLGREFSYDLIRAAARLDDSTLQEGLRQLGVAEVLYQRGVPPEATYTFKHALLQDTAYESLVKSKRQQLHSQVAQVLQQQSPETVATHPELVAHHYTEAGLLEQAIPYWRQAGERAAHRSACVEAVAHLTKGLALLQGLPDTPERVEHELAFQTALGPVLIATRGFAAPETGTAYARARELCERGGESSQLFRVLQGVWVFNLLRANLREARELGEQFLGLAQNEPDPAFLLDAHLALGASLLWLGDFDSSHAHMAQGTVLYDRQPRRSQPPLAADPGVICLSNQVEALWYLGYPDQAQQKNRAMLTLAQELAHPFSLSFALNFSVWCHQHRGEAQEVQEQAEALIILTSEQGFALFLAQGNFSRGWALTEQGQVQEGLEQLRQGLGAWQATGAVLNQTYFLALLAEGYEKVGQREEGLNVLTEALAAVDKTGERYYEAELYRLKGELTLQSEVHSLTASRKAAEVCFHQALEVARQQSAKSWELRATMSLARLWQQQGKKAEARQLLSEVYSWFTEGFDTKDLQEAKALLEELS
jgi:class 3 adenylate cyclase/predicted ATPase